MPLTGQGSKDETRSKGQDRARARRGAHAQSGTDHGTPAEPTGPARRDHPAQDQRLKKQLLEKQRLRAQYNVSERQLQNAFTEATRQSGNTGVNLVRLLEMRLDAVVVRAGFVRTIYAARQAVVHGHVHVNGRKVDRPSRQLQPGDTVALAARSRDLVAFTVPLENARPPAYLDLDKDRRSVRVRELPEREQIPVQAELSLIVEFYSR